jgi:hypothetical protein
MMETEEQVANGHELRQSDSPALPPLRVSGVVVRKQDLIAALRVYLPELRDVQVTDDGEQFWLACGSEDPSNTERAPSA